MLNDLTRTELENRVRRLTDKIRSARTHQDAKAAELAGITRDIEADEEMRELLTQRLDRDRQERRDAYTARQSENDHLS